MTTLHTPAPWHLQKLESDFLIVYSDGVIRSHVARLFDSTLCEEHGSLAANARLIAAAPQMLSALRAALEAMGDSYDATDAAGEEGAALWDQVANAIESATGESADY